MTQQLAGLNAQMDLPQILETAQKSERYQQDFEFHLLTDWLKRLSDEVDRLRLYEYAVQTEGNRVEAP